MLCANSWHQISMNMHHKLHALTFVVGLDPSHPFVLPPPTTTNTPITPSTPTPISSFSQGRSFYFFFFGFIFPFWMASLAGCETKVRKV